MQACVLCALCTLRARVPTRPQMIQHGCDPNIADYDGRTALELACVKGHLEVGEPVAPPGTLPPPSPAIHPHCHPWQLFLLHVPPSFRSSPDVHPHSDGQPHSASSWLPTLKQQAQTRKAVPLCPK